MDSSIRAELQEMRKEMDELKIEIVEVRSAVDNAICTYRGRHMSEHEFNEEFKKSVEKAKMEIKEGKCTVCNTKEESDKFFAEL